MKKWDICCPYDEFETTIISVLSGIHIRSIIPIMFQVFNVISSNYNIITISNWFEERDFQIIATVILNDLNVRFRSDLTPIILIESGSAISVNN